MSSYVLLDLSTRELVAGAATFLATPGNWLSLPSSAGNPWEVDKQWSRQYGSDILHLNVFGTDLIIVNSHKAASTLLERRSALYSKRPKMTMINELYVHPSSSHKNNEISALYPRINLN
ncbi:hypothetical protein K435DRAFT_969947 [Dendrothele bispora CBS 962.96]|uniref:Uncharacterized protein n=1 Tax=Dendrothele bispora (strain CBS 962.96) TaxID=1314807 RepID=A0A4S8LF04_DENBC|nr:hypothetical protein K435DRAFT_969947 [Dendrothele bispora CBS 962.96]